ncbi:ribokinase [Mediterraneibacter massiliensis]|jgi:ribokinase|uniref:ribokinase n=1 Tax=Mediterraneibacter massiliensis TaxID=1720300 RepID=UPI0022E27D24|nr:ribokinase [Mediterraneibacter massiliensis]
MKKIMVLGSLNMDFVISVKEMPQVGETILGKDVQLVPGGKGANQAYAAGKLGGNVMMMGAVGKDLYGDKLLNNLSRVHVDTSAIQKLDDVPTGQAFVSVYDNGDNSIIVIQGANGCVDRAMVDANRKYLDECEYIIMQLEIPLETVQYVKDLAVSKGKKVIIDPAPAVPDLPDSFWKNVTLIKPNETEIGILTGRKVSTVEDAKEAAEILVEKGVETVIVTLGGDGCLLVDKENEKYFPANKVECIDTTAAGDSFIASLVVALSEGKDYENAIAFAQKVSAIVVTRQGAQTSIPCRTEIQDGEND